MIHLINNYNGDDRQTVRELSVVETAAEATLAEHQAKAYEVSILLTDDSQMRSLNRQYRFIDQTTDVLAFPMLSKEEGNPQFSSTKAVAPLILGDIVISIPTARNQASTQLHSLKMELVILTVHGTLHLLGYDHLEDQVAEFMFQKQNQIVQKISAQFNLLFAISDPVLDPDWR